MLPERCRRIPTPTTTPTYYTEALREYLLDRSNILGDTEQERDNQLYRGGLRIHTTLDPMLQAYAEEARDVLPDNDAGIDAAIVSLDSKTGAIRAMVGGGGFEPGQNEVNMALVATPDRVEHQVLHPRRRDPGRRAGRRPDRRQARRACCPNPGDPKDPFVITDAVSRRRSARSTRRRGARSTARSPGCRRSSG